MNPDSISCDYEIALFNTCLLVSQMRKFLDVFFHFVKNFKK